MSFDVRVQVQIHETLPGYGEFHDALLMSTADYAALTEQQLDSLINERVDRYKAAIDAQRVLNADPAVIAEREAAEAADRQQRMRSFILTDTPELDGLLTAAVHIVDQGKGANKAVLKDELRKVVGGA